MAKSNFFLKLITKKLTKICKGSQKDGIVEKKNSANRSPFLDPIKKILVVPKYPHDPKFYIKLTDITKYASVREGLKYYEKDDSDLNEEGMFETDIEFDVEIEAEPFSALFNKNKPPFEKYNYMKGFGIEIINLGNIMEQDPYLLFEPFLELDKFEKVMIKNGFIVEYQFSNEKEHKKIITNDLNVPALKQLSKEAGLKVSLKKQELIDQIINCKDKIKLRTAYIYDKSKTREMLSFFHQLYINDIGENMKRFHRVYHESIKDLIVHGNDFWECVE